MEATQKFYEQQSNTLIQNLKKRNMAGYFCPTLEEAVALADQLIEDKSLVSFGGSMTLQNSGLLDHLHTRDITLLDRARAKTQDEVRDIYLKSFSADTYLMSTNAISLDGHLVNIDGNGNRLAALIYGPKQVIILAGMNKVASNLDDAILRVRNMAAPPNCIRLSRNTPCAKTGFCHDCQSDDCICSNTVITRRSNIENRIKVILVGESLGY